MTFANRLEGNRLTDSGMQGQLAEAQVFGYARQSPVNDCLVRDLDPHRTEASYQLPAWKAGAPSSINIQKFGADQGLRISLTLTAALAKFCLPLCGIIRPAYAR